MSWGGKGNALGGAEDVLLEGAGGVVPAYGLVEADAVVAFEACHCEGVYVRTSVSTPVGRYGRGCTAAAADAGHPFDAHSVAKFDAGQFCTGA